MKVLWPSGLVLRGKAVPFRMIHLDLRSYAAQLSKPAAQPQGKKKPYRKGIAFPQSTLA